MLQIHKSLSRKLWVCSTIAVIGIGGPALVYGMSVMPEYAKAAGEVKTLSDIGTMQEMTADICSNSKIGDTKPLTDTRDNSTYTVKKLNSEQCWMTQNLRLTKESLTANKHSTSIDSSDSDMTSGSFSVPDSSESGFSSHTASNVYYPNDTTKGAYYTWCAATAGSCSSATTAGVNAANSICPKGWHLPVSGTGTSGTNTGATSDTKNDFMVMAGKTSTSGFTDSSLVSGTNITLGITTWPFAGLYSDSAPGGVGSNGYYWSRTASSSPNAYNLYVYNNGLVYLANYNGRRLGFSVRCVAYAEPREGSGNVNVSVASTITIDATAGMTSEVEAATPATGNITARISANTPYKVLLGASTSNPGNKTSLYRRTDDMQEGTTPTYDISSNNYIPTVSGNASVAPSTVEANTNAWGISNSCNKDGSGLAYLPITTAQKEYCGSSMDEATLDSATGQNIHTFGIGISVSSSLASGTYETNVTVTGVAN